jgi:hypothetical protein
VVSLILDPLAVYSLCFKLNVGDIELDQL